MEKYGKLSENYPCLPFLFKALTANMHTVVVISKDSGQYVCVDAQTNSKSLLN